MIKEEDGLYYVYNHEGTEKLSKGYESRDEAVKRLGQIEYFKMEDENEILDELPHISFKDKSMQLHDGKVVSIRDGVMEYYGSEIGHKPHDKIFKVYRSPEEVKRIAPLIEGIPITDGHIEPSGEVENDLIHGLINTHNIVDAEENKLNSSIAVEHEAELAENMLKYIQDQKPETSLGYTGKLVPHDIYDFEQVGITPHHLAVVRNGRCGKICKFKDEKVEQFLKEDGTLDLEAFMKAIGEAMEKADETQKAEVLEMMADMLPKDEIEDEEADKEDNGEFKDESAIKADAVNEFKDSKEFQEIVFAASNERAETIEKAKSFLDESYEFKNKPTCEIVKDAVNAEHPENSFTDSEMKVAFDMLKATKKESHMSFGDKGESKWQQAKHKEL